MVSRERELAALPSAPDPPEGPLSSLTDRLIGPFLRGAVPPPEPETGFYTDTTVCIGCKACEVACKQWNQIPADGFKWTGNSYDNTGELSAMSWRHVKFVEQFTRNEADATQVTLPILQGCESKGSSPGSSPLELIANAPQSNRWLMMSDVCKHCDIAPCQQACPTGAIIHNEFHNVYIQADICNGCSYCVAACPFGVITRSTFDGHSHKCTLCYDRQRDGLVPACAKACPTQSIQFGPIETLRARAQKRVEDLHQRGVATAYLYGDTSSETYSSLNSFYLLVDRPAVYGLPEKPFNPWLHMGGDYVRALVGGLLAAAVLVGVFLSLGR
jgi:formate dehydrogenase iron-sulfur subunit